MPGRHRRGWRGWGRHGPARINRFVEPALLLLLNRRPQHGYALMEGLNSLGFEEYPLDFSGIYRTLRSLEEAGMVRSDWDLEAVMGPPRRVYTITPDGQTHLANWVRDLRVTDRILHAFLEAYDDEVEAEGTHSNGATSAA